MTKKQWVLSIAVGIGLLALSCQSSTDKSSKSTTINKGTVAQVQMGKCIGANACNGKSECNGDGRSCAGTNNCNGKGWVSMSEDDCTKLASSETNKKISWAKF